MEFLSAATGKEWVQTEAGKNVSEKELGEVEARRQNLSRFLTEVLLSENLVILAGLGTTLCITDLKGKRVAPTMPELWKAVAEKTGAQFDAVKEKVRYKTPPDGDNIELLLSQCLLLSRLDPSPELEAFTNEAEALIVERCRFVSPESDLSIHESFLRKVARRNTRQPRLRLFTTNYDLAFENAASHTRFIAVDGFSHTQPQEFDGTYFNYDFVARTQDRDVPDYLPNVFHLYKLHGSLDWELDGFQVVKKLRPKKPLIIYPRMSKFESSYDQPFIELMSRFQLALREANTGLLVIGFGFNDHHIVQPIMSSIRSNVGLKVLIVDPALKGSNKAPVMALQALVQEGDWRLGLLASRFEEVVPRLPDLVKETEDELHQTRLRALAR